jgi:hypothetical protein
MRLPLIKYGNISQDHRETDRFFGTSGVQLPQHDRGLFNFRRVVFSVNLKAKVGSTLAKAAALCVSALVTV